MESMLVLIPNGGPDSITKTLKGVYDQLRNSPTCAADVHLNSYHALRLDILEYYNGNLLIRLYKDGRDTCFQALDDLVEANDLRDDCHPYVIRLTDWRAYDAFDAELAGAPGKGWKRVGDDMRDEALGLQWFERSDR